MVASYSIDRDSFNADRPRRWSDVRLNVRPRGFVSVPGRPFDVHPDGARIAGAVVPAEADTKLDHVVMIFNVFDELKRIAPAGR